MNHTTSTSTVHVSNHHLFLWVTREPHNIYIMISFLVIYSYFKAVFHKYIPWIQEVAFESLLCFSFNSNMTLFGNPPGTSGTIPFFFLRCLEKQRRREPQFLQFTDSPVSHTCRPPPRLSLLAHPAYSLLLAVENQINAA